MTIVITLPHFFRGEADEIARLLRGQVDIVHIRKPEATEEETERLIRELPSWCRPKLALHDHHTLAQKYHLGGIHLNSRNPEPPSSWTGRVSRSCHSMQEIEEWKTRCDYVSLSPIFDSISKRGYRSAFSPDEIREARRRGIIDEKVMALGGVTFARVDEVMAMGFGGAMILGDAWKSVGQGVEPTALTIAGSDSSAGAGIQQDLKAMRAAGVYAATAVTALTSQNTTGITDVMNVPPRVVRSQVEAVLADMNIRAIKIGMVPDRQVARVIVETVGEYKRSHGCHVVYDPVMVSTSGRRLMDEECMEVAIKELMPLATLLTPNLLEARCIMERLGLASATELAQSLNTALLLKGGHSETGDLSDSLFMPDGSHTIFPTRKIDSSNMHGTGCALSSAIAACLAKGMPLSEAITEAKRMLSEAILRGRDARIGKGNGPVMM